MWSLNHNNEETLAHWGRRAIKNVNKDLCPQQLRPAMLLKLLILRFTSYQSFSRYWYIYLFFWRDNPQWARVSSLTRFLGYTLLWKSDHLVSETSTRQYLQHAQQTNIHTSGGIRTHNLSRRVAANPRLRPRVHWDRLFSWLVTGSTCILNVPLARA
jgi:hypothetical protein